MYKIIKDLKLKKNTYPKNRNNNINTILKMHNYVHKSINNNNITLKKM